MAKHENTRTDTQTTCRTYTCCNESCFVNRLPVPVPAPAFNRFGVGFVVFEGLCVCVLRVCVSVCLSLSLRVCVNTCSVCVRLSAGGVDGFL